MAWAASFFGCVAGEVIATRMRDPQQGLIVSAVLGAIAGFVTLILWLRLLRRSPELQEALAVTPEGVPDTAAKILDELRGRASPRDDLVDRGGTARGGTDRMRRR